MTDIYDNAKRSAIMASVRVRRTAPEQKVAAILKSTGLGFQHNVSSLPGSPDFVVKPLKTVIFVHGCFWHGHPNCKRAKLPQTNTQFWLQKITKNKRRDRRVVRQLRLQGWRVLTIWQCRLRNPDRVIARLYRFLVE